MRLLTHLHMHAGDRLSFGIRKVQNGQTLAVRFNPGSDPVLQQILFIFKRLQNIFSTAHRTHPLLI